MKISSDQTDGDLGKTKLANKHQKNMVELNWMCYETQTVRLIVNGETKRMTK